MGLRHHTTGTRISHDVVKLGRRTHVAGWIIASAVTIILALLIRAFLFQTFRIPSTSMSPTLVVGDHIIVSKLTYGFYLPGMSRRVLASRRPTVGDVVVFYRFSEFEDIDENVHYVKRVIAVPGDDVQVRKGLPIVNGKEVRLPSSAAEHSAAGSAEDVGEIAVRDYGPVKLGQDEFFVTGDNRPNSKDSRFYGPIHLDDIVGRAVIIYWSWGSPGFLGVRWSRIGRLVR